MLDHIAARIGSEKISARELRLECDVSGHELNHTRCSLGGRTACAALQIGRPLVGLFGRRKREEVFEEIKALAVDIVEVLSTLSGRLPWITGKPVALSTGNAVDNGQGSRLYQDNRDRVNKKFEQENEMRKWRLSIAILVGLLGYGCLWWFSYSMGIRTTAANARYFYYGNAPGSPGDRIGYVLFWPIYKTRYVIQSMQDEGHWDVHWSDRTDPIVVPDSD